MNVMVSLVCVNVAGVSRRVTGAVFVSWWGGGRVGREEEDQSSFASFLICLSSVWAQGREQSGAGVPSSLSSFLDLTHLFGSHLPHIAHSSPTRSGCEGDEEGQRR